MKLIKNILIGLGSLFILLVALLVWGIGSSTGFLDKNQPFIEKFSRDLALNWRVEDVHSRVTNDFLQSLKKTNGTSLLSQLLVVGELQETSDYSLENYSTGTRAVTDIVTFKATYQNAKALVTITVVEDDDGPRVKAFHVSVPDGIQEVETKYGA